MSGALSKEGNNSIPPEEPAEAMRSRYRLKIDGLSIEVVVPQTPFQSLTTRMARIRDFLERVASGDDDFTLPTRSEPITTGLREATQQLTNDVSIQVDDIDFNDSLVGAAPLPSQRGLMDISLSAFTPTVATPYMASTPFIQRPASPVSPTMSIDVQDDDALEQAELVTDEEIET